MVQRVSLKKGKEEELLDIFVLNVNNLLVQKEDQVSYQKSSLKSTF